MKSLNKRIASFFCAAFMMCAVMCPVAEASQDGQISPRIASCSVCWGRCSRKYVSKENHGRRIGECGEGTHYYVEDGEKWVCDDCDSVEYENVVTGHYCTGQGDDGQKGHYCMGSCGCKKK